MEAHDSGMTRANDLRDKLISLQRQCDGTWPVRGAALRCGRLRVCASLQALPLQQLPAVFWRGPGRAELCVCLHEPAMAACMGPAVLIPLHWPQAREAQLDGLENSGNQAADTLAALHLLSQGAPTFHYVIQACPCRWLRHALCRGPAVQSTILCTMQVSACKGPRHCFWDLLRLHDVASTVVTVGLPGAAKVPAAGVIVVGGHIGAVA